MIRVFIGYDARETVAWHVLTHSILARSSQPVSFVPLSLSTLKGLMWRAPTALQSTEFSFSRFLTPFLSGYEGWSIFMDCDMLMREDIAKLWALRDERYAVMCVKHDHQPAETTKFLGQTQTAYGKKNWSSVMLFNNAKCRALTLDYINAASGLELHQFKWLGDDELIGGLPRGWNHLTGYDKPNPSAKNVHFTIGGPYFTEYAHCEHSGDWFAEQALMLNVSQRSTG